MSFEPFITRRAWPASEEYFTCRFCGRVERDVYMDDPQRQSGRAMCQFCAGHWGRSIGFMFGPCTRGDKRAFRRLSAAIRQLEWEVKNGRYRTRPVFPAQ
jgi:hypothetical protein